MEESNGKRRPAAATNVKGGKLKATDDARIECLYANEVTPAARLKTYIAADVESSFDWNVIEGVLMCFMNNRGGLLHPVRYAHRPGRLNMFCRPCKVDHANPLGSAQRYSRQGYDNMFPNVGRNLPSFDSFRRMSGLHTNAWQSAAAKQR